MGTKSLTSGVIFELDEKEQKLKEIEKKLEEPDFWTDNLGAQKLLKERKILNTVIENWKDIHHQWEENKVLFELAADENDEGVKDEVEAKLEKIVKKVEALNFATCYRVNMISIMPLSASMPVPGVPKPRTG